MSDNEHSFPILWDSEILAVKHLPFHEVPQFIKRCDDSFECIAFVVGEQSFDVLKNKMFGSFSPKDSSEVKEQSASCIFKSSSLSSNAKTLARESSSEEVEVWKSVCVDCCDVAIVFVGWEMLLVDLGGVFVNFGETNT